MPIHLQENYGGREGCEVGRPAVSKHSNSSQRCSSQGKIRPQRRPLEFFHSSSGKPCLYGPTVNATVMMKHVWVQERKILMLQHTQRLYSYGLPSLWQQFMKAPHISVMVKCQQTFGHVVYYSFEQLSTDI